MKKKIKEIIVVEGKDDIIAVKRAYDGNIDVIATHGLGFKKEKLIELYELNEKKGIIVLTDPDYAGKRIENKIRDFIPNAKFASITKKSATKNASIGVENASDEAIIAAIDRARPIYYDSEEVFDSKDIVDNGLSGAEGSKDKRIALCKELSISYCNAKQLLIKLNSYGITREEFEKALSKIGGSNE